MKASHPPLVHAMPNAILETAQSGSSAEIRFALAITSLLKSFNFLELNVGLCIAHLENISNPRAIYPELAKMSAEAKLDRLQSLLTKEERLIDPIIKSEVIKWFARAHNARYIRNRYVHGHWDYLPLRAERPVEFQAFPWMEDRLGDDARQQMTLADLECVATDLEEVFQAFMRIRKMLRI